MLGTSFGWLQVLFAAFPDSIYDCYHSLDHQASSSSQLWAQGHDWTAWKTSLVMVIIPEGGAQGNTGQGGVSDRALVSFVSAETVLLKQSADGPLGNGSHPD